MRPSRGSSTRWIAPLLAALLLLAALPGVAAAEQRVGGTVVVAVGETVDGDLEAFAGTVVVRGTVNGDLEAFGGDVRIEGAVTGDVDAAAGNVWITGTVGGDVDVAAGNVYVQPGAAIGGRLSAAAGNILVAGTVGGNANLAGGAITLAETATIDGNVEYAAEAGAFADRGATVGGTVTRVEDLAAGPWAGPLVPPWLLAVYAFLVNLALGAVLLVGFPRSTEAVVERAATDTLRSAGAGLVAAVVVSVLLGLLAVTLVGIPFALVGAVGFGVWLWVGLVYGRYAFGVWVVSRTEVESRWLGLVVGLAVLGLVGLVPVAGGLVTAVTALVGAGAVASLGFATYRGRATR